MIKLRIVTPLIVVLFLLSACRGKSKSEKITIAAASNMQYVVKELIKDFTKSSGPECQLVIGSSGQLTAQIKEGAPYDIFVSADMKYPNEVFKDGMARFPPRNYGSGKLVLWTMKENIQASLATLTDDRVTHIALANPKNAPYGKAAIEVLKHYHLLDSLQNKLVYGESISQTNQFINSRSAEIGFTALGVVLSPQLKEKGNWIEIDPAAYSNIQQGVVLIKRGEDNTKNAKEFYDYLFSKDAKLLLKNFGYLIDE